jgi:hypothetical protein
MISDWSWGDWPPSVQGRAPLGPTGTRNRLVLCDFRPLSFLDVAFGLSWLVLVPTEFLDQGKQSGIINNGSESGLMVAFGPAQAYLFRSGRSA